MAPDWLFQAVLGLAEHSTILPEVGLTGGCSSHPEELFKLHMFLLFLRATVRAPVLTAGAMSKS